ncbi:MAG: hypothetical protein H0V29_10065 [Thermoleophilaceae bacterium]|nr:hypothetical protein [Thermoleophilaceae bacterium]
MPNLPKPRLRRSRAGAPPAAAPAGPAEPRVEVLEHEGLRWINIERPGAAERAWLEERFDFHPLDYEDVASRNQRPKVVFSKGAGYLLYTIVDDSFDYCFPMLAKMGNKLDRVEEDIFEGRSAEIVREISNVKQEVINFRKIIRPQRSVLRDLERTKQRYLADDMDIYFDDIVDASERIWDVLENYKEVVEALEDSRCCRTSAAAAGSSPLLVTRLNTFRTPE